MRETLYSIFSSLPFCLCLFWWVLLMVRRKAVSYPAHRYLSVFAFTCTLLYFCHAAFFNGEEIPLLRVVYYLCHLAVYPLFWIYIRALTEPELPPMRAGWVLLPSALTGIALIVILACGGSPAQLDLPIRILFMLQMIWVCVTGGRRLTAFDRKVKNFYVDTENKSLRSLRGLFFALILISILSTIAGALGRSAFLHGLIMIVPSALFSVLLFAIFHVGLLMEYTAVEMASGSAEEARPAEDGDEDDRAQKALLQRIQSLFESQQMYLTPGLKITDVAEALDTNRTYISASINRQIGTSFSDYVNGFRVRHAQALLRRKDPELTLTQIGIQSGFSGDTSFFRNFKKVTGQTPSEWLVSQDA